MPASWERYLKRWTDEGLIDASAAEGIRAYEADQERARGLRWPVMLAIGLGGLLLGAGVLLLVAAHWDRFSPAVRFSSVLLMVAFFHVSGALVAERFSSLSTSLHAVGTICLGAGIFLAGQIFHLQEHWPTGVFLWALGAWAAWALLRDWPQAAFVALLTPMWLSSEWLDATRAWIGNEKILAEGLLLLALSYFTAVLPEQETPGRKTLAWIGGLTLIPLSLVVVNSGNDFFRHQEDLPLNYYLLGWTAALLLPLLLAGWLRRRTAWTNLVAAIWVVLLGATSLPKPPAVESLLHYTWRELGPYLICALGSIGLIAWGLHEARKERVNLGTAGFALTVLVFYFSTVMEKLSRSVSLIGLGVLFLLGGWLMEKMRRRLVSGIEKDGS